MADERADERTNGRMSGQANERVVVRVTSGARASEHLDEQRVRSLHDKSRATDETRVKTRGQDKATATEIPLGYVLSSPSLDQSAGNL